MLKRPEKRSRFRRLTPVQWVVVGLLSVVALILLFVQPWFAMAYVILTFSVFLLAISVHFWGTLVFGGLLEAVRRKATPVPWTIDPTTDIPEHDLDPGLELLAAGVLVYRFGEVKPQLHFRQVPLASLRAIRPFIVARTGSERTYTFDFSMTGETHGQLFARSFDWYVADRPQIVLPDVRLSVNGARTLARQRWNLQVRSGVTVVTRFWFEFVDEHSDEIIPAAHDDLLARLLDEVVRRDVESNVQEVVLEGLNP